MTFQLNHDDTFEANIPDGEYEVVIKTVGENVTQNGAEYCQFDLVIRNDVEQLNKNNHIFHKVWRTKATGDYNPKSFNSIGKATNLPNGKTYANLQELFEEFVGKAVRVKVKNETSQYNGNTYENLNVKQWIPSRIQGIVRHVHKEQAARQAANEAFSIPPDHQLNISDDDLPF